jgi:hypothetical protein
VADASFFYQANKCFLQFNGRRVIQKAEVENVDNAEMHLIYFNAEAGILSLEKLSHGGNNQGGVIVEHFAMSVHGCKNQIFQLSGSEFHIL